MANLANTVINGLSASSIIGKSDTHSLNSRGYTSNQHNMSASGTTPDSWLHREGHCLKGSKCNFLHDYL